NMRRVEKGFSGVETPLFEGMIAVRQPAEEGLVDEQFQVDDAVEENVTEDFRRLRKVGASRRIESSDDMEDVFNQGKMIDDMDKDEGIKLVKDADIAEIRTILNHT
nr:hypothetical protein [Tanacetum cinerariifolium]